MNSPVLTAILVDDESHAIANLQHILQAYCTQIQVIATANNADLAIEQINSRKPDVVFLDVNMPGKDGFSILNRLVHKPFIVFVTAHQQHAIQALKMNAVDFLLKPIDIQELAETEKRLLQLQLVKQELNDDYYKIIGNLFTMLSRPGSVKTIALYTSSGYELFQYDDIVYLNGVDNYTRFHFRNRKEIIVPKTLKEYEEMLQNEGFMRIHKSFLVNLTHVKQIAKTDNLEIEMSNGDRLNVARRKAKEITDWVKHKKLQ